MPTPSNSLNLSGSAGIVLFDGTSSVTTTAPTNHAILIGTGSNSFGTVASGTTGQVLQAVTSNNPAYSTATYPSASVGSGKILYDNGTNFVTSTPTFPTSASASTGKIIISDGTNWVASTPTYPNSSATSGKILISDGTNFVASTPTYPNTSGSAGKVVVSDGTNNVYSTPTFPNASATTRKIIVSDGTNWVASTETWAVPGTSGHVLTSDGTNWTSAVPATSGTVTSVSGTSNQVSVANGTTTPVISLVGPYTPATYTTHGVLVGEGTSSIVALAAGSAGQVLQSGGASADPTYSTATYPASSGGTGKILYDNGTNFVESTPTFPASASATSRKIIVSDGTNWNASTETWATPGSSGNVLTSDGTNWTSAAASGGGFLIASVTLTNSQIKALHATPIQLIAAPGAGKGIVVLCATAKFTYGGNNAFTAANSQAIGIYYNNTTTFVASGSHLVTNSMITSTANKFSLYNPPGSDLNQAAGILDNVNLAVYQDGSATEITGNASNDNTIDIQVSYYIVTF